MRVKRLISLVAAVALIAALFCCGSLSAAAASGWTTVDVVTSSVRTDVPVYDFNGEFHELLSGTRNSTTISVNIPDYTSTFYVCPTFLYPCRMSFVTGDSVLIYPSSVGGWFAGASSKIYAFRFVLLDSSYNELASGAWIDAVRPGNSTYNLPWVNYNIRVLQSVETVYLGLQMRMIHADTASISVNHPKIKLSYGDQQAAEVAGVLTGDNYNKPDSAPFDDYEKNESNLLGSQQDGLNAAGDLFSDFSLGSFAKGMAGWVQIIDEFTNGNKWLSSLLTTSLAIGVFAFVVSLARIGLSSGSGLDRVRRR